MAPHQRLLDHLHADVEQVRREYAFVESFLRCAKVGDRLDVEVDYVVDDHSRAQTVRQFDEIRAVLAERLDRVELTTSMSVGFTADRRWVAD
jgi:predicted Co/Zn/Cd cation transporter (cation efflux family)